MEQVDTSSYPKLPATPPSFLDTASKLQGLQTGAISNQQQQLALIQQRFKAVAGQIPGLLSKPDLNQNDIQQFYQNNVKNGFITDDQAAMKLSQLPPTQGMPPAQAALTLKNHMGNELQQAQSTMEALQYHLGQGGSVDNGASINPTLSSPKPGFAGNPQAGGVIQPQPGIPTQPPVTQGYPSPGGDGNPPVGTPVLRQPSAPPTGLPTQPGGSILPFKPGTAPPQIMGTGGVPTAGAPTAVPTQKFIATGNPPQFAEGQKQLAADQDMATQRLTAIKQAQQALPLMKGIMSGPTTGTFTNALATAKAYGIIPTSVNDPVIARQEVLKKLNAYVASSPLAGRSDAGLLQTEASSPNPNIQNLPALTKLTQDAIALDRVQAARAGAFTKTANGPPDANGKPTQIQVPEDDLSKYPTHRSTFPAQVDERAFGLDNMEPKERDELMANMTKGLNRTDKNGKPNPTFEAKKFFKSLNIVDQQGLIDTGVGQ